MGNAQGEPPQPTPYAKGAGVPERKFGSEALEASVKLRKSSIECLSAASFEAARRRATEAWFDIAHHPEQLVEGKGWQLLWSPKGLRPWHPSHASSGATLRSVSSFAKATEDTLLAFIHGFTRVAFCEGG